MYKVLETVTPSGFFITHDELFSTIEGAEKHILRQRSNRHNMVVAHANFGRKFGDTSYTIVSRPVEKEGAPCSCLNCP